MKILAHTQLSAHKYKTPEGYLVCVDAILARTGKQEYRRSELFGDSCDDPDECVNVDRPETEVFDDKTLASFENKAICLDHPDEDVDTDNHNQLSVGFVRDIKRGKDAGQDVMMGTLVITDANAIEKIESGEYTELSCGYNCDISENDGELSQTHIRGNHVALCQHGRAGNARIVDQMNDAVKYTSKGYYDFDNEILSAKGNAQKLKAIRSELEIAAHLIGRQKQELINKIDSYLQMKDSVNDIRPTAVKGTDKIIYVMQSDIDKNLYFYIGKMFSMKEGMFGYTKFEMENMTPEQLKRELTRNGWHQVTSGPAKIIDAGIKNLQDLKVKGKVAFEKVYAELKNGSDDMYYGYRDRLAGVYDKWYRYNRNDDGREYDKGQKLASMYANVPSNVKFIEVMHDSVNDGPDFESKTGKQQTYEHYIQLALNQANVPTNMWNKSGYKFNINNNKITLIATESGITCKTTNKNEIYKKVDDVVKFIKIHINDEIYINNKNYNKGCENYMKNNDWSFVKEENYKKTNEAPIRDSIKIGDASVGYSSEHNSIGDDWYGYIFVEHPRYGNFYVSVKMKGRNLRKREVQLDGTGWNFIKSKGYTTEQKRWIAQHKSELEQIRGNGTIADSLDKLFEISYVKDNVTYIRKVRAKSLQDAIVKINDKMRMPDDVANKLLRIVKGVTNKPSDVDQYGSTIDNAYDDKVRISLGQFTGKRDAKQFEDAKTMAKDFVKKFNAIKDVGATDRVSGAAYSNKYAVEVWVYFTALQK